MGLTFRDNKGSALTFTQMDSNFRHFTGSFTNSGSITANAFSGSFSGDGSGLTGVTGEWDGTHVGDAQITGSLVLSGSGDTNLNVLGNITASGKISGSTSVISSNVTVTNLSSGRVVYTSTNGRLASDTAFTFDSSNDILTVNGGLVANNITASGDISRM